MYVLSGARNDGERIGVHNNHTLGSKVKTFSKVELVKQFKLSDSKT